jgi:Phosphodiester glycosidase
MAKAERRMKMRLRAFPAFLCAAALLAREAPASGAAQNVSWRILQPGVELAEMPAGKMPSGDAGRLYAVRVDPQRARLGVGLASEARAPAKTAGEWCRTAGFAVAINLGMFQGDQRSNVGYLRHGGHLNNRRWNSYRSAVAIGPLKPSLPAVLWLDLATSKPDPRLAGYDIVVQNLRLITRNRKNVWSRSSRQWSEAALAVDSRGRLLFLFSRAPYSMRDFNDLLLSLPLDIAGAMHLEGGPEASLSIHTAGLDLDLSGSYETGFLPDDSNRRQWPIPNVLGVLRGE